MKMKSYPSFDAYFDDQPAPNRAVIRKLRAFVKRVAPELEESVKWGNGCWLKDGDPIAYVYTAPDHTQFGFIAGSALRDPRGVLLGAGKWVRHVRLLKAADIDEKVCADLLGQAVAYGHPAASNRAPKASRARKPAARSTARGR